MSWNGSDSVGSAPRADRNDQTPPNCGRGEKCAAESAAFGGKVAKQSRSDAQAPAPARPHKPRSANHASRSTLHGLLAGLLVVALGGAAVWWFFGRTPADSNIQTVKHSKISPIAEVTPSIPHKKAAEAPKPPPPRELTEDEKRQQQIAVYERQFGTNMPPAILAIVRLLKNPPKGPAIPYGLEYPFLKHPAERSVANVLFAKPGTYRVMRPDYGADFDQDFLNSLVDKLKPEDGDTDEVKLMKENIEAAKKELAEACKESGKKPSEVMNEYADSLFELGQFNRNLEDELNKIYENPELTNEEVKDFCAAANKMLESKGLSPLPYPDLTERNLEFLHEQYLLQQKAKEKGTDK